MNVLAPVSTIMTKDVIFVAERDRLSTVRDIFNENRIHHLPVVRGGKVVGIISKEDLLLFMKGLGENTLEKESNVNNDYYRNDSRNKKDGSSAANDALHLHHYV